MDSETKMNVANTLIWVSIITCALAIASIIGMLCISTGSPKEMQTDIQVDVLAITVTILIGWNIYQLIDVKGIRKELEAYKKDVKSDINRHLLLEENALAVEYCRERDWNKVLTIRSNMAHRLRQLLENDSDTNISDFVNSVAQMIEQDLKGDDYIQHGSQLAGFMAIFQQLSKYDKRTTEIYNRYKENDLKYRKSVQMDSV